MPDTESHDPSSTADPSRVEYEAHPHICDDIYRLDERLQAVEKAIAAVRAVAAIRADLAAIADGVDPTLKVTIAELVETSEHHSLLLGRLLDRDSGGQRPERPAGRDDVYPVDADDRYREMLDEVAAHDPNLALGLDETVGVRLAEAHERGEASKP
jgi:hypothetical protein